MSAIADDDSIRFGPFRLDLRRHRLWHFGEELHLRPKVWDALSFLAHRPDELVSHAQLMDAVWPDVAVTPNALTRLLSELRLALGGKSASASYLQTVPKRGVRFSCASATDPRIPSATPAVPSARHDPALIGCGPDLTVILGRWQRALAGARQLVFVRGMPGVGKSTLADAAVAMIQNSAQPEARFAKGQCLMLQGDSEPYLPAIEIFEQLAEQVGEAAFSDLARRFAPTWLVQMPWLTSGDEHADTRRTLGPSTSRRVVHEAVRLLDRLSKQAPLVLVIEDMQWADAGTLDLLYELAEHSGTGALMVLTTYRSIEVAMSGHPIGALSRTLCTRGRAIAIDVEPWSPALVGAYLDSRFHSSKITETFAASIAETTHGLPLFVRETADHLVRVRQLRERDGRWDCDLATPATATELPESLRAVVESWLMTQNATTTDALAAASLVEGVFTVQEVAAALDRSESAIDDAFADVERGSRLLEFVGTGRWPDGTTTTAYRFSHVLYQRVVADRIPPLRGRDLHLGIANRIESAFQSDTGSMALRLARHFDAGGAKVRGIVYLELAAVAAANRYAYADAIAYLKRAIAGFAKLPGAAEWMPHYAERWLDYASLLHIVHGIPNDEARDAYETALQVATEAGDDWLTFRAELGLCFNLVFSGDLEPGLAIGERLVSNAERTHPRWLPASLLHLAMAETALGRLDSAVAHLRRALTLRATPGIPAGWNLPLTLHAQLIACLGLTGEVTELDALVEQAQRIAGDVVPDQLLAATVAAAAWAWNGRWREARLLATRAATLADELEVPNYQALSGILRAQAELQEEPARLVRDLNRLIHQRTELGERWWGSCFDGWLATAHLRVGELDAALATADRALAAPEQQFRGKSWRIRGLVLAAMGRYADAEQCFREGARIAELQGARVFAKRNRAALAHHLRVNGGAAKRRR